MSRARAVLNTSRSKQASAIRRMSVMDQSRTLWTHRIEPLDYPVNPKTVERLKALKEKK